MISTFNIGSQGSQVSFEKNFSRYQSTTHSPPIAHQIASTCSLYLCDGKYGLSVETEKEHGFKDIRIEDQMRKKITMQGTLYARNYQRMRKETVGYEVMNSLFCFTAKFFNAKGKKVGEFHSNQPFEEIFIGGYKGNWY